MRPCDATTERKILKLQRDNFPHNPKKWSILLSGSHVSLHPPEGGGFCTIPAADFKALAEWYLADQSDRSQSPSSGE